MSDLVKRLRGWRIDGTPVNETMREAADEIERLRQAVLDEREACARLLEDKWFRTQMECIEAIRARGEVK